MNIKHVYQTDSTGCGPACIAMIVGKSYNEVKDVMFEAGFYKNLDDDLSTTFKEIIDALNLFNIRVAKKRKFKLWKNIPAKVAIVSTNYDKFGIWHWFSL